MEEIGIGSRVKHKTYGDGVVVQVKSNSYNITFIESCSKVFTKDAMQDFEIIDATIASDDIISLYEVEKSLTYILQEFSDIQETVHIGNKWNGGSLILQPGDKNYPY